MSNKRSAPTEENRGGKRAKNAHVAKFKNWKKHTKLFKSTEQIRGALLTGNQSREGFMVGEVLNLFNFFAKLFYPEQWAFKEKMQAQLKSGEEEGDPVEGDKQGRFFEVINAGCNGTVFVSFVHDDVPPTQFIRRILTHLQENREPKFTTKIEHLSRIIPLESVCEALAIDNVLEIAHPLIKKEFPDDQPTKFGVRVSSRNNDVFNDKMKVIDPIVDIVGKKHSVFLSDPDKMILVEVFKSAAGIGILPDYEKLRKYNVQEICNTARKNNNNEKQHADTTPTSTTTQTTTATPIAVPQNDTKQ